MAQQSDITITIAVSAETARLLTQIIDSPDSPRGALGNMPTTLHELTFDILTHFADGQRRPGSWERSMLEMMGYA